MRRGSKHNLSRAEYLAGMAYAYAPRGEQLPKSRLTVEQVRHIRESSEPCSVIAKRLGVHENTVGKVRRYESWAHV